MDFDVAPVCGSVTFLAQTPALPDGPDAPAWFERGLPLEATDPAGAEAA